MKKSPGDIILIQRNGFIISESLSPETIQSSFPVTANSRNQKTVIGTGKQINMNETTENMCLAVLNRSEHSILK